jgi:hypothetical protein
MVVHVGLVYIAVGSPVAYLGSGEMSTVNFVCNDSCSQLVRTSTCVAATVHACSCNGFKQRTRQPMIHLVTKRIVDAIEYWLICKVSSQHSAEVPAAVGLLVSHNLFEMRKHTRQTINPSQNQSVLCGKTIIVGTCTLLRCIAVCHHLARSRQGCQSYAASGT